MTCGVYEFWCGPHFYQGSSKNIENRWKEHQRELRKGRHHNPRVQRAYDKYGWTDAGVLAECEEHTLLAWEQAYLDTNWGDEKFINLSPTAVKPCGRKGRTNSPEHRAKISAAQKGKTLSDEHRAKLSESHKGLTLSIESRAKLSAANKGKTLSDEHRAKLKGRTISEEHRAKLSAAQKGRTISEEHRAKLSAAGKAYYERKRAEKMNDP
jgi:group I intron endonuclease